MAAIAPEAPEGLILILAPFGRDAPLAAQSLRDVAPTKICPDVETLRNQLFDASAVVVTEEAMNLRAVRMLAETLATQPSWSDLPFIVFTSTRASIRDNRRTVEALSTLGNVTELERPVHPLTMVSAVRAAIRARGRQYDTRALLTKLEAALRQRDAFLAILGHELRNPLGAIGNAVELVQRSPGRDVSEQIEIIQRQVRVLSRLVNDLLDVSRVTSEKVALVREPVDVVTLVERMVAQVAAEARRRQVQLSLRSYPAPLYALGDRVRLEQVFTNLIGNALKYTPLHGRIDVAIDRARDTAVVTVSDSGVGIPADALPRIFDLFAQADTSLDRSQGGLGIGLTLVRSLVQLHGGMVDAASAGPGRGSEFTVTLPLGTNVAASEEPSKPKADRVVGRNVLLVEDNADNRLSLRALLEELGHRVSVASDGAEGVEIAVRSRPEIALIDIGLPELDGYEVARRIRAVLGRQIRLVALTGYGLPEDVRKSTEAGFDAHLVKPVDLGALELLLGGEARSDPDG